MKINVISSEADAGWIYTKFIDAFKKYSKNKIVVNSKDNFDILYFLPYYEYFDSGKPTSAWFSHQEAKDPLNSKFISVGKNVNHAISQSKKYANILKSNGVKYVTQIVPGVDLTKFKRRKLPREKNNKLIVGYIGRSYISSNRKNPKLLNKIKELKFVDFRVSGGQISQDDIPNFYASVDIIVSPSFVEGGSMALIESLACGVPCMCFEDVGMANEFGRGIIRVPFGDDDEFLARLKTIWSTKSYMDWREAALTREMRQQVEKFTWDEFARRHDMVWNNIICTHA